MLLFLKDCASILTLCCLGRIWVFFNLVNTFFMLRFSVYMLFHFLDDFLGTFWLFPLWKLRRKDLYFGLFNNDGCFGRFNKLPHYVSSGAFLLRVTIHWRRPLSTHFFLINLSLIVVVHKGNFLPFDLEVWILWLPSEWIKITFHCPIHFISLLVNSFHILHNAL